MRKRPRGHTLPVTTSEPPRPAPGVPGAATTPAPQAPSGTPPTTASLDSGAVGTAPPPPSTARRRARATGRGLFLALLIFVTVVLVLFVVFNTQKVDVSLVFGNVHAPLIIALVVAAALGGLIVGFAMMLRAAARRRGTNGNGS